MFIDKNSKGVVGCVEYINPPGPIHGEVAGHSLLHKYFENMNDEMFKSIKAKTNTYLFMLVDLTGRGPKRGWPLAIGTGDPKDIGIDLFRNDLELISEVVQRFGDLKAFITDRDTPVVKLLKTMKLQHHTDPIHNQKNGTSQFLKGNKMIYIYKNHMCLTKMFQCSSLNLRKVDPMSPRQNLTVCRNMMSCEDDIISSGGFLIIIAFDPFLADITATAKHEQLLVDEAREILLALSHTVMRRLSSDRHGPGRRSGVLQRMPL